VCLRKRFSHVLYIGRPIVAPPCDGAARRLRCAGGLPRRGCVVHFRFPGELRRRIAAFEYVLFSYNDIAQACAKCRANLAGNGPRALFLAFKADARHDSVVAGWKDFAGVGRSATTTEGMVFISTDVRGCFRMHMGSGEGCSEEGAARSPRNLLQVLSEWPRYRRARRDSLTKAALGKFFSQLLYSALRLCAFCDATARRRAVADWPRAAADDSATQAAELALLAAGAVARDSR